MLIETEHIHYEYVLYGVTVRKVLMWSGS